ncbi:diaminopropionate ammonia-lyase [Motiliproteus sp. MSK22-1]|uniref:diaminopropionate ammonia-lyase n=1 Tax=Motiliproteus sp. MSK22-1 TaxID=1897630 RepID=UPI000977C075|nr:diaminopropionate ammonia-lyase [Motiliproteus sp. MSK22-1]OMH27142.1 diaminopropionate ammonia-lyase [Motiliproteus sp. MSK22-1]
MLELNGKLTHFANPEADINRPYSAEQKEVICVASAADAINDIRAWPDYEVTPLFSLESMADTAGLASIWYKDESQRFGLKSFKALGGAYAVARQLQQALELSTGNRPSIADLLEGRWKSAVAELVVSCATDGNHGRSVAWGAQMFGCGCVIYIHRDVSEGRKKAMEAFGAEVIRIIGNYDDSVRQADMDAKANNRIIVSDTSYEGYMEIPKDVALGYTVMLSEIVEQLEGEIPTHVFVQGGVGGLASAIAGYFWDLWGNKRPRIVIVEPEQANCLQMSARAGKPVAVEGDLDTLMAGLACGEVSALGWKILATGADDFMTLSEEAVPAAMRLLAKGYQQDPAIEAGESAVPGLAAALLARQSVEFSEKLGLTKESKVLVIGTEGATDPVLYQQLVG